MAEEKKEETITSNCAECGIILENPKRWQGLYCVIYCCGHCPHRRTSPCQKEIFEAKRAGIDPKKGTLDLALELYEVQNKK